MSRTTSTEIPDHTRATSYKPPEPQKIGILPALAVATLDIAIRYVPVLLSLVFGAVTVIFAAVFGDDYDPAATMIPVGISFGLFFLSWFSVASWTEFVERVLALSNKTRRLEASDDENIKVALAEAKREAEAQRKRRN